MTSALRVTKLLDFSSLPNGWTVQTLAFDWDMNPMLVVEEGKPGGPPRDASPEAVLGWLNHPPKAHHLIHWNSGAQSIITFERSTTTVGVLIQRLDEGWLYCEGRRGAAFLCDSAGRRSGPVLDLGDAIEDVQTARNGDIWVSYFDEGVFGSGIGSAGLVCFDRAGHPRFRYSDLAKRRNLPIVGDLSALNVVNDSEVWICYYDEFPLVRLRSFECDQVYPPLEPVSAFAIDGTVVLAAKAYENGLFKADLQKNPLTIHEVIWHPKDIESAGNQLRCRYSARGRKLGIVTATAAYVAELAQ